MTETNNPAWAGFTNDAPPAPSMEIIGGPQSLLPPDPAPQAIQAPAIGNGAVLRSTDERGRLQTPYETIMRRIMHAARFHNPAQAWAFIGPDGGFSLEAYTQSLTCPATLSGCPLGCDLRPHVFNVPPLPTSKGAAYHVLAEKHQSLLDEIASCYAGIQAARVATMREDSTADDAAISAAVDSGTLPDPAAVPAVQQVRASFDDTVAALDHRAHIAAHACRALANQGRRLLAEQRAGVERELMPLRRGADQRYAAAKAEADKLRAQAQELERESGSWRYQVIQTQAFWSSVESVAHGAPTETYARMWDESLAAPVSEPEPAEQPPAKKKRIGDVPTINETNSPFLA